MVKSFGIKLSQMGYTNNKKEGKNMKNDSLVQVKGCKILASQLRSYYGASMAHDRMWEKLDLCLKELEICCDEEIERRKEQ